MTKYYVTFFLKMSAFFTGVLVVLLMMLVATPAFGMVDVLTGGILSTFLICYISAAIIAIIAAALEGAFVRRIQRDSEETS